MNARTFRHISPKEEFMEKHLIIGASGMVGSRIVDLLVQDGRQVRATTHRREAVGNRNGIERMYFDAATGQGLEAVFEGVDRAFLMVPPGFADHYKVLAPLIAEARRRGLERVVLMTAMGANLADTPFRKAEEALKASGLGYAIVRPNWFMQNFNTFWLAGIRDEGVIRLPVGKGRTSFIDARDIAAVAAQLLTAPQLEDIELDVTGPTALDHDEVARILSMATNRPVRFENVEPEVLGKGLVAAGVPADYAAFLLQILALVKQNHAARVTPTVRDVLGREPIGFGQYAREHRELFKQAA
jgi:uncharacterized protein YbjT (DUF2867 family)